MASSDDSGKQDRGRPVITVVVLVVCALAAALLFRQLNYLDSSPKAAGSADPVANAAHQAQNDR